MTVSVEHRRRLESIQARVRTAREKVAAGQRTAELADKANDDDARHVARIGLEQARGELDLAQGLERAMLGQVAGVHFGGTESFLDDPSTVSSLERLATSSMPIGRLDLGPLMSAEDMVGRIQRGDLGGGMMGVAGVPVDLPPDDGSRVGPWYGVVPQLRRRLRLLDLIPTQTMTGGSFHYSQESGSFDTAVETAEMATKPPGDAVYTDVELRAVTIPHYVKEPRQVLADVPQLQTAIQNRLLYGCLRRVENQVLAGDGVGENLRGILNTTGIGSVAFSAGEAMTDLTLDAITTVLLSDAEPNGAVVNPSDFAASLKLKATTSGVRLDSDGAYATPPTSIWGLPAVTSRVMAQGKGLVGDFANGATIFIREGPTIRISDSDQDDFVKNMLTILAEVRVGIAIWQPAAFSEVAFA